MRNLPGKTPRRTNRTPPSRISIFEGGANGGGGPPQPCQKSQSHASFDSWYRNLPDDILNETIVLVFCQCESTGILDVPYLDSLQWQRRDRKLGRDLRPKETIMAERVGQQLGNYRLVSLLGQGGFAEVYLGQHVYLDTLAAIKILHARIASDDVEHFLAEARTVARLVHPHIVRVLEFDVKDSIPYLVVDYAPNGTLRKRHPRSVPLPLSTVVSYVTQLASAL